jgi:hypothetical protein
MQYLVVHVLCHSLSIALGQVMIQHKLSVIISFGQSVTPGPV